jgi:AcrR family transcriptional regulator
VSEQSHDGVTNGGGSKRARGSLSREEILDGAQEIVEEHGLRALSMPALAKQLRSGVTSIYWYFKSKDELVQALTERVTKEVYSGLPPVSDGPWEAAVIDYFVAFRELIERSPIYREVFAYRAPFLFTHSTMAPGMLRRLERGLDLFVRGGMTAAQAGAALNACAAYTRGYSLLEHSFGEPRVADAAGGVRRPPLDAEQFPVLTELTDFRDGGWLDDDQFRFGLRVLIDGFIAEHGLRGAG